MTGLASITLNDGAVIPQFGFGMWITTKLSGAHGYDAAVRGLEESLERLGTDHVDLYLIHSPGPDGDVDTWRAFEALRADGRARSIGVSNFSARRLDLLIGETGTVPAVNQVKLREVAGRRGCTPAQALLRWHLHHGFVVFPKSADPERLRENVAVTGVQLTGDDLARIDGLGRWDEPRRYWRGVERRVRRVARAVRPTTR